MAVPRPTSRGADWRSLLSMLAFGHRKVVSGSTDSTRPARRVTNDLNFRKKDRRVYAMVSGYRGHIEGDRCITDHSFCPLR
jgi:hypothetical protein